MLLKGVNKAQCFFHIFPSNDLCTVDGCVNTFNAFASDVVNIHFGEQFIIFAYDNIDICDFVEARVAYLVVVSDEKLAEAGIALGVFGQVVLVTAVKIGLEIQLDGFFIGHHSFQGLHFHHMGKALQRNANEHYHYANKLDDMVPRIFHQNLK